MNAQWDTKHGSWVTTAPAVAPKVAPARPCYVCRRVEDATANAVVHCSVWVFVVDRLTLLAGVSPLQTYRRTLPRLGVSCAWR
jgi:hypothetical protein